MLELLNTLKELTKIKSSGLYELYLPEDEHKNTIYFATDKKKIYLNGLDFTNILNSDWNELDKNSQAYIKNKPDIPINTSQLINDSNFVSSDEVDNKINTVIANTPDLLETIESIQSKLTEIDTDGILTILSEKVDKVQGKDLSTNDFTNAYKDKLDSLNNYDDTSIFETLNNKVDKVQGKRLTSNDFTNILKSKLESLENYDDTEIWSVVNNVKTNLDTLLSDNPTQAIKTFNDIIAFLDNIENSEKLESIIAGIELQISDINTNIDNININLNSLSTKEEVNTLLIDYATKLEVNNKVDKIDGKSLSTNDFTNVYKDKLDSLNNYDDTNIKDLLNTKVDKITGKGLSTIDFTNAYKNKLESLENYDDTIISNKIIDIENNKVNNSEILDMATKTWVAEQNYLTEHQDLTSLISTVNNKVDKIDGKSLSTNDFSTEYKNKLDSLEIQIQSDWNITDNTSKSFIKNKPTIPTAYSQLTDDLGLVKNSEIDNIISEKTASLIEIVVDSSKYDEIINTEDGLINILNDLECGVNITKTDFATRGNDIKFIRFTNPTGLRTTLLNIVFCMPSSGVFCGYGFNKLDGTRMGIGYATIRYATENTVKISAVRSYMTYST